MAAHAGWRGVGPGLQLGQCARFFVGVYRVDLTKLGRLRIDERDSEKVGA